MKQSFICLVFLLLSNILFAQDEEIDASKPTNFYTQLYNHLEYNYSKDGPDTFGYRAEFMFAPSEAHLLLAELPLLHNTGTNKTGIGDFRARYFYLPYKNYDKLLGAFGPSVDVFAPTGDYDKGLGTGTWLVQPGVTVGLMFADWIQAFPILSYQYTSSPVIDRPELLDEAQHGISFQIITPIIFSEKFFMQVTPIYTASNLSKDRNDRYIQEVVAQYALSDKLQISSFYRGIFKDNNHTARLALLVFL
ncbi:hypothetical protein [Flammeovirga kamogawensis]|uniref:Transporter n=1 Tax=Flammeovirga kamogawensis TaxID=373891 RepID=A0ABX8GTI8_9BACT|nr:hypothetical protein [Flammeovirga kamogawensis]MBB6462541.1 hypothetical protein [Flammeovirga kamogawensis]QWG06723.1 transporter [Flammeovirga kamogawensis]TRX68546.1 hypothetical protein EO216_10640 [Flammeovirga kamogawensis]